MVFSFSLFFSRISYIDHELFPLVFRDDTFDLVEAAIGTGRSIFYHVAADPANSAVATGL